MNREILFRGKRVDNSEWVYGFYTNHCVDHLYIARIERTTFSEYGEPVEYTGVDNKTVGQYIGLQDSKGNKIFEGDIIISRMSSSKYFVSWKDCQFEIKDKWGNIYVPKQEFLNHIELDVVGNIHDNPELLTDKT